MIKRYVVIRDNKNNIEYLKYEKLEGFNFKPLNNLPKKHGVIVTKMVLFKPEFIEYVLKKKIKHKLNEYLKLILESADDSSSDPVKVRAALNDVTRYRQLILNNYRKYLEERYVEILLSKISVIEEELKNKLVCILYQDEDVKEVGRKR